MHTDVLFRYRLGFFFPFRNTSFWELFYSAPEAKVVLRAFCEFVASHSTLRSVSRQSFEREDLSAVCLHIFEPPRSRSSRISWEHSARARLHALVNLKDLSRLVLRGDNNTYIDNNQGGVEEEGRGQYSFSA